MTNFERLKYKIETKVHVHIFKIVCTRMLIIQ